MKIVNSSHEIMPHPGINESDILRRIERIGRVCYKSEDKITDTSAETFVGNIIKRNHGAVLEHGSLLFMMDWETNAEIQHHVHFLESVFGLRSFLRFTSDSANERYIVSGNVRAWREFIENCGKYVPTIPAYLYSVIYDYPKLFPEYADGVLESMANLFRGLRPITIDELQTDVEIRVHYDISILFTCDRGVTHEIVRHRPASYAQESTRYCNYSNEKFGSEVTYIDIKGGMELDPKTKNLDAETFMAIYNEWLLACEDAELHYNKMLELGASPQIARSVLNNSTKTEICITMNMREWRHFFKLRTPLAAHPQMREIANPLLAEFKEKIPVFFDDIEVTV